MIESDNSVIRTVAWRELFPWLNIIRAFRIAISGRCLFFAAAGIMLTGLGWWGIESCFTYYSSDPNDQNIQTQTDAFCRHNVWEMLNLAVPDQLDFSFPALSSVNSLKEDFENTNPVTRTWSLLNSPAKEGLSTAAISRCDIVRLILCGLWGVFVWGFFGTAICRIAVVRLAADESVSASAAMRYAWRKWAACLAAPLLPLVGAFLIALPVIVLGWILRSDFGLFLGGLVWPLSLIVGFVMTVLLAGVFFGWPLMWAAISTERDSDSFDALSRSYAYVFQRPLNYLFYSFVAAVFGWLGWILVRNFASGVVWFSYWAASWGCTGDRLFNSTNVSTALRSGEALHSQIASLGGTLIRFWIGVVQTLAFGFVFSYFWSAATAVYLLMRRDVDAAEMDEVFLDADADEPVSIPTVNTAEKSSPVVATVVEPIASEKTEDDLPEEITGEHE